MLMYVSTHPLLFPIILQYSPISRILNMILQYYKNFNNDDDQDEDDQLAEVTTATFQTKSGRNVKKSGRMEEKEMIRN